jgi:hypothetical protein
MPYCEACGAQVNPTAKFCGSCGAPRNQPTQTSPSQLVQTPTQPVTQKQRIEYYSPPNMVYVPSAPLPIMTQQPQPQPMYNPAPTIMKPPPVQTQAVSQTIPLQTPTLQGSEATVGVILLRKMKSLGRYDTFAGVVTTERMIFAQLTADMLNEAAQQAREQAKADGKGFFGAWGDQLKATFGYTKKYLNMPPASILQETPGNFALYNNQITEIKFHLKKDYEGHHHEFEVEVKSSMGTYKYAMDENSDFTNTLKRVYGDRVKMPFGYHSTAINIKF